MRPRFQAIFLFAEDGNVERWKSTLFSFSTVSPRGALTVCVCGVDIQAGLFCAVPAFPSVPVCLQRNLTEYFVAVDVNNMLQLYASMLHERRIIITSTKLSTVSPPQPPPPVSYQRYLVRGTVG